MRTNKYNVAPKEKRMFYNILFDSKEEGEQYLVLIGEEKAGRISNLKIQVPYLLQEAFVDAHGSRHQDIEYVVDFVFFDRVQQRLRHIDIKGFKTDMFKLKRKLFNYVYKPRGYYIEETI